MRDAINEALSDAICDGEGRTDVDHLVHHLAKRGLLIVAHDRAAGLRSEFIEWYRFCFGRAPDAHEWESNQLEGATFRSIVDWLERRGDFDHAKGAA
jgi:hypothetical protein